MTRTHAMWTLTRLTHHRTEIVDQVMAEELARKKRVRAGHKSSTIKMMTRVEEIMSSGESLDPSKLNQLRMSLREKLEEIKVVDGEILSLVKDDEVDDEIAQADLYKEKIYSNLILIEATIPAPSAVLPPPTTSAATPTSTPSPTNKVRLPKLTIKAFNGKLTAWIPFWDSFKSAIHDNPELSKVDKI